MKNHNNSTERMLWLLFSPPGPSQR